MESPETLPPEPAPTNAVPELESRVRHSLAGRISAAFFAVLVVMAVVAAAVIHLSLGPWLGFLLVLLLGLPLGVVLLRRALQPVTRVLAGLRDGILSFSDRDFSVRLPADRTDELGELARLYNRVGDILQHERLDIRQRELLLQTALDRSPVAIFLVNAIDRIIFANTEARRLLTGGRRLVGHRFAEIRSGCPEAMREILASDGDGVFRIPGDEVPETYHLAQRSFRLNTQHHSLILLHRMTGDLGRQEAETWKKVIRVISHELNNSLAPISSLLHSARIVTREPQHADRADEIFGTIQERIEHLTRFIEGYARFSRLPAPRREATQWQAVVASLGEFPFLRIEGRLPGRPGLFDRSQIQQLLVNLLRNAVEASSDEPDVALRIQDTADGGVYLQVMDRGEGMDETTMKSALLPFYSTKQTGTGLGLPLCREIVEAHGGKISLQSRPGGGTLVTCWLPSR